MDGDRRSQIGLASQVEGTHEVSEEGDTVTSTTLVLYSDSHAGWGGEARRVGRKGGSPRKVQRRDV